MCRSCEAVALEYAAELARMWADECRIQFRQNRDRKRQRDYLKGAKETAERIADAIHERRSHALSEAKS